MDETLKQQRSDEQRVNIKDIKPDMILSRDVFTGDMLILLPQNMMLNNINFTKLRSHDIEYVYVKKQSIQADAAPIKAEIHTLEKQQVPITDRSEYKAFISVYDDKKVEMKKHLLAISDGETIELDDLFRMTDSIMDKLTCKSDVLTFIGFIKDNNEHTFTHSSNVALLCNLFGRWLALGEQDMVYLTTAGILHDIGKTKTPPEILNKKGRLTEAEFVIMKNHTVEGYRILQTQKIPEDIKPAALLHHEKIDGTGYPLGVKGDKINKIAKIVGIVDIYDAMTANRVYRGKICPFEVIRTFETKAYGELDTEMLLVFLRNIAYTYIGNWVTLSDGRTAEVMFINQQNLSKPIVRTEDQAVIDLMHEPVLNITALV